MFRYLTSIEQRLRKIEAVFAQLLPDVDLEECLLSGKVPHTPRRPSLPSTRLTVLPSQQVNALSEALPDQADGFEWKEETPDLADLTDGMGALSVDPAGVGYLGKSPKTNLHLI